MKNTRINNTFKNTAAALFEQGVYNVMSFICRTVFIYVLGKTYLGFSGLFSDILRLLSLAELGVGTAILYSMYKPVANKDYRQIAALLNLYRKVYHTIGVLILIVGVCITPFLDFFISNIPDMPEIPIIYLLYLINTVASYFFIYKKSILITNQKIRTASVIYCIATTIQNILQIISLILLKNFIIYLVIQVICTFGNNIAVSNYVDKHYPYLKQYRDAKVDEQTKNKIYTNVKAMFMNKISAAVVTSTDNILISKFVSTVLLGIYSNYALFVAMFRTIITKIFEALTGSVGNLVILESPEYVYKVFRRIWFVNYWLVAFCSVLLFVLVNPFISLWVGESYLLDQSIVFLICLNLYMRLIRNTFLTFNSIYGHFVQLRWKCALEAIINFCVSLFLVLQMDMGIFGILLGTFISNITTNFWYEPYLLFSRKFGVGLYVYFGLFLKYFLVTAASGVITFSLCNIWLSWNNWIAFFIKLIFCCAVVNILYFIVFFRTDEFQYFKTLLLSKLHIKTNNKGKC